MTIARAARADAAEADGAFTTWAVCSDTKMSSSARNDTAEESAVYLPIPATTDGQRLADSLNANNAVEGLQVVFATYQSIEVIHRAQEIAAGECRDFNLTICDGYCSEWIQGNRPVCPPIEVSFRFISGENLEASTLPGALSLAC